MKKETQAKKAKQQITGVAGSTQKKTVRWQDYRRFLINTCLEFREQNQILWNAIIQLQEENHQIKAQLKGEY